MALLQIRAALGANRAAGRKPDQIKPASPTDRMIAHAQAAPADEEQGQTTEQSNRVNDQLENVSLGYDSHATSLYERLTCNAGL